MSTLTLQLAFAVSRGGRLSDACVPLGDVFIMSAEDDLSRTIKRRLEEADADCSRIHAVTGASVPGRDGEERSLTLNDIDILSERIEEIRPTLIVLDPIQADMGGDVDVHRMNEVRSRLAPLARLAAEYEMAILIVLHLNKGGKGDRLIHRANGSMDFTAAPRSVLHVARHPVDIDDRSRRVLVHAKCNLAPLAPTLGFTLGPDGFRWTGEEVTVKESDVRADEAMVPKGSRGRPPEARRAAEGWLATFLAGGSGTGEEVYTFGEDAGHTVTTLKRAAVKLGVIRLRGRRLGDPSTWSFPMNGESGAPDSGPTEGPQQDTDNPVGPNMSSTTTPSGGNIGPTSPGPTVELPEKGEDPVRPEPFSTKFSTEGNSGPTHSGPTADQLESSHDPVRPISVGPELIVEENDRSDLAAKPTDTLWPDLPPSASEHGWEDVA